jgi:putative ABC transport system permease protein
MHDLKFAFRQLLKNRGFTIIAVITLALGIGANTLMFGVLNSLLLHQPPYPETDSLVRVFRTGPTYRYAPHSPANFLDFQAQTKSFSELAAYGGTSVNLAEAGQPAVQLPGLRVSGNFFAALGVQPALGRFITAEDDRPGSAPVVVLSDPAWRQYFAADPTIVGRPVRLDGQSVTVLGVMPAGFDDRLVWGRVSVWCPLAFGNEDRQNRGGNFLSLIGRLRPGVTSAVALAEMQTIGAALAATYPETNAQTGINLVGFVRSTQDKTVRLLSLFAMGLAACVLLIACANLANLLFARNVLRHREHAIRAALGASRARLILQSLTESLLLALGGGGLGLLLTVWGNQILGTQLRLAGQDGIALALDWRVAGFAFGIAVLAAVGFGLVPALLASRTEVGDALKQGTRGSTSGAHQRLRHALIVSGVALAVVLLSGAGFFIRGLDRFASRDHGWRTTSLLTASLSLPGVKYENDTAIAAFYDRLLARLMALPGVEQAALARSLPFHGFGWGQRFVVEGQPLPKPGTEPMRDVNGVTPGYFDAMGIGLVAGRVFAATDLNGPVRTIISESMATRLWPGGSALGKRIAHPVDHEWQEVIGVVRDVKFASNLESNGGAFQTYRLLAREPDNSISIVLRCTAPPGTLTEALRRTVAELDPELPVSGISPAVQVIEQNLSKYALTGWMLLGFALLGLLLAVVGIYGIIAGFVAQRTNEIGIRMALGAQMRDVLRLVLGQGLRLALLGCVIGLAGAWWVARLLQSIVPALPPSEPLMAAGIALLLLATALLASWLPARRAARVDPMVALRSE